MHAGSLTDSIGDLFDAQFDASGSWIQPLIPADRLVESRQTVEALRECLAGLPGQHREVFQLRQVDALSATEVGGILGYTSIPVGVLFHGARI